MGSGWVEEGRGSATWAAWSVHRVGSWRCYTANGEGKNGLGGGARKTYTGNDMTKKRGEQARVQRSMRALHRKRQRGTGTQKKAHARAATGKGQGRT